MARNRDVRKLRTRERNVSVDAKPVSVRKGDRLSDRLTDRLTTNGVGLSFDDRVMMQSQKKYRADKSRVEAYNRREKRNLISISDMNVYGNYTFKVNGVTYRTLESAFEAANELKKKSIKHYDFDEKPSLEDVSHYGIKGMKWGIRRSQEELDRAADRWRERELKYASKRSDKRIARLEKSYNRALDGTSFRKMHKRRTELDFERVNKFLEEEYIKNMTSLDSIKKERREIGKAYTKAYIFGTGDYYNRYLPLYDFTRGYRIKKQYEKVKSGAGKVDPDTLRLMKEFYEERG